MHLKMPLLPQLQTMPPTLGPSVEAECMVDDQVFACINEPHIPELRKKDRWWKTPTNAGDGAFIKTPGGRQRETTSLLFPRIWQVRSYTLIFM